MVMPVTLFYIDALAGNARPWFDTVDRTVDSRRSWLRLDNNWPGNNIHVRLGLFLGIDWWPPIRIICRCGIWIILRRSAGVSRLSVGYRNVCLLRGAFVRPTEDRNNGQNGDHSGEESSSQIHSIHLQLGSPVSLPGCRSICSRFDAKWQATCRDAVSLIAGEENTMTSDVESVRVTSRPRGLSKNHMFLLL